MNCGTEKGLLQHKARNEPPCKFCARLIPAPAEPASKRTRGPAKGSRPVAPCGQYSAYIRHKKDGEPIDADCQKANDQFNQNRRTKRAQAKETTNGL